MAIFSRSFPRVEMRKTFSYNKRTMDRAMGPFFALVALPRINNLRAVSIVISSTPAASTSYLVYFN